MQKVGSLIKMLFFRVIIRIGETMYSGERKKCRSYKKGYCESLNRRMFLIFTQYIDMELLFQNM